MQFDPSRKRSKLRIEHRPRMRTWVGRIKFSDGTRTPSVDLMSDTEEVAQLNYDRWFETGTPPETGAKQAFAVAARTFSDREIAANVDAAADRRQRLETYAIPRIGHLPVCDIKKHHVASVLDAMADKGRLAGAVLKLRSDISRVLAALARSGAIEHNVALGVELGDHVERDDRPRVRLTDEEIVRFRKERGFHRELDMMCLFARDLGGYRTSDLHGADYSHFDTVTWATCQVRRPKTDGDTNRRRVKERGGRRRATRTYQLVRITIPPTVKGPVIAWWEAHGRPTSGPVFPLVKGDKVGARKTGKGISYAKALRKALWEAGIRRPMPGYEHAVGDARKKFCRLQVDTDETRAVDFHSFRGLFITALANAGSNMPDILDAAGHTQESTSHRYRGARTIDIPEAALPGGSPENKQGPPESPFMPEGPKPSSPRQARQDAVASVLAVLRGVVSEGDP